jgi:hypothetical protein
MSRSGYSQVSQQDHNLEEVELQSHGADSADASESSGAQSGTREFLTKRAIYSSAAVEQRTPRLPNENDAAYKRRVHMAHLNSILHSIGWVAAAIGIIYYTDMWNVVRYDTRVMQ